MTSRETERIVKVNDEVYKIRKFPVMTGAYFIKFLIEKLLPAIGAIQQLMGDPADKKTGKKAKKVDLSSILSTDMSKMTDIVLPILTAIKEEDLKDILTDCLNYCDKQLPAGYAPVVNRDGSFGVAELEYDLVTCLKLCFEVLKLNLEGFFGEGSFLSGKLPQVTVQ